MFGVAFAEGWFTQAMEQAGQVSGMSVDQMLEEMAAMTGMDLPADAETLTGDAMALAVGGDFDPDAFFASTDGSGVPIGVKVQGEPDEIALADTIGVGVPAQVRHLVAAAGAAAPGVPLRLHLHDTRNTAIANALAAVEAGVSVLDASVGGIGGCPFAPAATGNVATEDLVYALHRSGHQTGLDPRAVIETAAWIGDRLGKASLPGALGRAGWFPDEPA